MNDGDQPDQTGPLSLISLSQSDETLSGLWTFDEFTNEDRSAADLATGLTSVGFIRAALRRGALLWCITGVVGMLVGFFVLTALPPAHQASASVLLGINNFEQPGDAADDDQAIAESRAVAGDALRALGMRESPAAFAANYTVTILTSRVLVFTVKATSSPAAVRQANALMASFLNFQKQDLVTTFANVSTLLQQQITQAQQHISSLNGQINHLSAQPATPAQAAKLRSLQAESNRAASAFTTLQESIAGNKANDQIYAETLVGGSRALDPAVATQPSLKRLLVIYVGTGLIAGLALGMFIVIVRALVSDKLRRRDDVARAIGAPVKLSVGQVRLSRRRSGSQGLEAAQSPEVRRIVGHLAKTVPPGRPGTAALAVVPVDDAQVAALSVASLAWGCAKGLPDMQIVVADLCPGAPAGHLLGGWEPGVHEVHVDGVRLVVAIPEPDDVAPVGPVGHASGLGPPSAFTKAVTDAYDKADLLLTLASLDPSLGDEQLAGWAPGAVAVVTAGRSSAERIHAVAEMIRLSGTELISAVLVGADRTDQSLGVTDRSSPPPSASLGVG